MALDFGPTGHGGDYEPERSTAVLFSICLKPPHGGIKTNERKAKKLLTQLKGAFLKASHLDQSEIHDEAFEYSEDDLDKNYLMLRFMSDRGPDALMLNAFTQSAEKFALVEYETEVTPSKDPSFFINVIRAHMMRKPN